MGQSSHSRRKEEGNHSCGLLLCPCVLGPGSPSDPWESWQRGTQGQEELPSLPPMLLFGLVNRNSSHRHRAWWERVAPAREMLLKAPGTVGCCAAARSWSCGTIQWLLAEDCHFPATTKHPSHGAWPNRDPHPCHQPPVLVAWQGRRSPGRCCHLQTEPGEGEGGSGAGCSSCICKIRADGKTQLHQDATQETLSLFPWLAKCPRNLRFFFSLCQIKARISSSLQLKKK